MFKPKFDFNELPIAYFNENVASKELRKQLIKNQVKIQEGQIAPLEDVFFSNDNIDLINKQLILTVYKKTNKEFSIPPQDPKKLLIVMRYVYIEYAKHLPYNIKEQIKELNCRVVAEVVPDIITNIEQYIGYLKDISRVNVPPPLPFSENKNTRTLPSISNIIHGLN